MNAVETNLNKINPLKIGGFLAFEAVLISLLKNKTDKEQQAIIRIIHRLESFDPARGDNLAVLVLSMTKDISALGIDMAEKLAPILLMMQIKIAERSNMAGGFGTLSAIDQAKIELLAMKNKELVRDYYRNTLAVGLGAMVFELLNQVQSKSDTIEKMVNYSLRSQNSFVFGYSPMVLNWARNTQMITSFSMNGVKLYRIVATLDERTTQICRALNGRVFSVNDAIPKMNRIINARNRDEVIKENTFVDFKDDIFTVNGVKLDLSVSSSVLALQGLGFPPYHWGCRSGVEAVN